MFQTSEFEIREKCWFTIGATSTNIHTNLQSSRFDYFAIFAEFSETHLKQTIFWRDKLLKLDVRRWETLAKNYTVLVRSKHLIFSGDIRWSERSVWHRSKQTLKSTNNPKPKDASDNRARKASGADRFLSQALICFEEEMSDSRVQFNSLCTFMTCVSNVRCQSSLVAASLASGSRTWPVNQNSVMCCLHPGIWGWANEPMKNFEELFHGCIKIDFWRL